MTAPWALVTGASGFLGARLVALLAARGERVKAMVRPRSSLAGLSGLPWDRVQLVYGDVTVTHSVYAAMAGCDRVYHLATNFTFSEPRRDRVLGPAIEGTRSVLDAARERPIQRLVVTGSAMTLGTSVAPEPVDETHDPWVPDDPDAYLAAKVATERFVLERTKAGVPAILVLPTAIMGPGDARPTPTGAGVIEYVRRRGFVPVTDGGLNVVDVDDVALGHALAMSRGRLGERYILGGENVTYVEMLAMLSDLAGLPPPWLPAPKALLALGVALMEYGAHRSRRSVSVTRRMVRDFAGTYAWVSTAKAARELGYEHRPARAALERSVKWYTDHGYFERKLAATIRAHSSIARMTMNQ